MNLPQDIVYTIILTTMIVVVAVSAWLLEGKKVRQFEVTLTFYVHRPGYLVHTVTGGNVEEAVFEYLRDAYHGPPDNRVEGVMYNDEMKIVGIFVTGMWGELTFKKIRKSN